MYVYMHLKAQQFGSTLVVLPNCCAFYKLCYYPISIGDNQWSSDGGPVVKPGGVVDGHLDTAVGPVICVPLTVCGTLVPGPKSLPSD
ncbi:hypothetical protein KDAU_40460 [Dictyobacter aurantiacus]|uniref:Uncharacterized protein n=1 Tax=Dictyobacter aurantiacus TaxID=1936993 RepID=A0A401ZIP3_9CHLR|nr:hypothetical protein KDAU_40460 [Dictyobacter aurantiacus]